MPPRPEARLLLGMAALGAAGAALSPLLAARWGWWTVLLGAAAVGAVAGPLSLLLALWRVLPGEAPRRTALRAAGAGLGAALLCALVGRGGFLSGALGVLAGVCIVVPLHLVVIGWVVIGLLRPGTGSLARARSGCILAVVLGMATWAVPAGPAVNAWDVSRAKARVERLAALVEGERARTGRYPTGEEFRELEDREWFPPVLLWRGTHYWAGEDSFQIGFVDRTELFGAYEYYGPHGGWDHWVD